MTQCQRVLQYLEDFGSISSLQAFADLGITRLASRIHDIKRMGIAITKDTATGTNRYGEITHYAVYKKVV